jgi:hypothetical protein
MKKESIKLEINSFTVIRIGNSIFNYMFVNY